MNIRKLDDYSVEITIQPQTPDPIIITYERKFIKSRILEITTARDAYVAQKEVEFEEYNEILKSMNELGIVDRLE